MMPQSANRFPAFAKPASAGEARSKKIMLKTLVWQAFQQSRYIPRQLIDFQIKPRTRLESAECGDLQGMRDHQHRERLARDLIDG
jgi:hypothetical protein